MLNIRNNAIANGVNSWKDPRCCSEILGIGGSYANVVDKIIYINRDSDKLILPERIENNIGNWKTFSPSEMFVDFETISDICDTLEMPHRTPFNYICMIGVGWKEGETWYHRTFICNTLDYTEENRVMNEFYNFVQSRGNPSLYYWSAEENFWKSARKNHTGMTITEENNTTLNWVDMRKIFVKEPITIKGVFNYGIKPIVEKMNKYGFIDLRIESECKDGMEAMIKLWETYEKSRNPVSAPIMQDVSKYNEFDCIALQKILYYLREKMM